MSRIFYIIVSFAMTLINFAKTLQSYKDKEFVGAVCDIYFSAFWAVLLYAFVRNHSDTDNEIDLV